MGFYKPMRPLIDNTALVEIYNRMMAPVHPRTTATYDYAVDRVLFSHDYGGIHNARANGREAEEFAFLVSEQLVDTGRPVDRSPIPVETHHHDISDGVHQQTQECFGLKRRVLSSGVGSSAAIQPLNGEFGCKMLTRCDISRHAENRGRHLVNGEAAPLGPGRTVAVRSRGR